MAIYHFESQIISRGAGRSAVAVAAYRHAARMAFEREGQMADFSSKKNVAHAEFMMPDNAPDWLRAMAADRTASQIAEAFWNTVETSEVRADAQLAKEFVLALPRELTRAQNIALVRDFITAHMLSRGMVADWVYHDIDANPHVHIMTTLRPLTEDGFGAKKVAVVDQNGNQVRGRDGKIVYRLWAGDKAVLTQMREAWAAVQNVHLARHGIDARVDHRSYEEQGIDLTPQGKVGVQTRNIAEKAKAEGRAIALDRMALHDQLRRENAARIARRPEIVIDAIAHEKSVFDHRDIARHLHRWIDDGTQFQNLFARIMASPELVMLAAQGVDPDTGKVTPSQFATRAMVRVEETMAKQARHLSTQGAFSADRRVRDRVLASHRQLSDEQRNAIAHVTGDARLALIVGRAGAGKTTMMRAAREIWEASGYRVVGGALAGKAADGLQTEAGIESRTLASWALQWERGRLKLNDRTVFVLDEAGMVSSRQMADFVSAAAYAGAKLVLVGDPDQLQPIAAGGAFRALADEVGFAELSTIYRQRKAWMRDASMALARGRVDQALSAYHDRGHIIERATKDEAIASMVADWVADYVSHKSPTLMLAFMRKDVAQLNALAREALRETGMIAEGEPFLTVNGQRRFAAGDRVVFLQNEASLGVKNGMLGRVVEAERGKITIAVGDGQGAHQVQIEQHVYDRIDHGYATTIHKSQGVTVDRVKVLVSSLFDRHLGYVALTRHRDAVQLYAGADDFKPTKRIDHAKGVRGVIVETGLARVRQDADAKPTPYVDLRDGAGKTHRLWGVTLPETLKRAGARVGDIVTLTRTGKEEVTVKVPVTDPLRGVNRFDDKTVERNVWAATRHDNSHQDRPQARQQTAQPSDLFDQLVASLSRSRAKATSRDFAGSALHADAVAYATRRGLDGARVITAAIRNQADWLTKQRERLAKAGEKLGALLERFGFHKVTAEAKSAQPGGDGHWLSGRTTWTHTIAQSVETALHSDAQLTVSWSELTERFGFVYQTPHAAMAAMGLDSGVASDSAALKGIADQLGSDPEAFGTLRGKTGWLASRADKAEREMALNNLPALRHELASFSRVRDETIARLTAQMSRERALQRIDVPRVSPAAQRVLEQIAAIATDKDVDARIADALSDGQARAEIVRLNAALRHKFGDRAFAARAPKGHSFEAVAARVAQPERLKLIDAWPLLHAAHKVAGYEHRQELAQVRLRRQALDKRHGFTR
ncbi:Ti-type conjugative transfer relaxase TraA [Pelagibacterium luteolum]|uniref:Plasmid mobilization system relaxase n=1 Tax=Pelagibacterium luteolum TaxID=440168 RepID=A0A1G7XDX7_9HYPH|nr:Ti-type conjugative transfer relaxase TraA [Pelagibacterium luteolum]SDG82432.1 plasmid mobilization system relaxase [Pelagibacterium luteolum]